MKNVRMHCRVYLTAFCLALGACRIDDQAVALKSVVQGKSGAYRIHIEGAHDLSRAVLLKAAAMELKEYAEEGLRPSSIDDAAFAMQLFYRQRGYAFARVDYTIEDSPPDKPRITMRVVEGGRIAIGRVEFKGRTRLSSAQLKSQIGGPSTRSFGLGRLYFVQSEVDSAATLMESLYYQMGHLDVRVPKPEVTFDLEAGRARLTYNISEGPHYTLRELVIRPAELAAQLKLTKRFKDYHGGDYYPRIVSELRSQCNAALANRGHADARCEAEVTTDVESGAVHIQLELNPGPLVRIGRLKVTGNQATRSSTIRSLVDLKPGELYSRGAERRSFRNLYASGLFSSVRLQLVGEGSPRDVLVEVEETATLSTSFELGYGAFERARVLAGVTEKNLFGTGRSLTLEGKLAQLARGAELFITDPYTIDRQHVLGATAFIEQRELVSFDSRELGAGLSLTQHITRNYRHVYGHEYRISRAASVIVVVPGLTRSLLADVNISALYLTNVYDTRDNFFLPTSGTWMRLRSEWASEALGSGLSFLRFDGRTAHYIQLSEGQQVAMHARGGVIFPTEQTSVIPLQERFFNGGQNTVRSFREDELGPRDVNGRPIGGEAYSVFSVEYRVHFFASISGALFADAGNVSLIHSDAFKLQDMRYALGPGLRWMLPIGPVRLDLGFNPNPETFEDKWVLQFSLGVAF